MELNYLYYRHGVSLMMAKAATSSCARLVHEEMAEAYAKLIADACPVGERQSYWTRWEAYVAYPCLDSVPLQADLVTPVGTDDAHAH